MQKLWALEGLSLIEKKSRVIKQQASLPSNNAHPINKQANIDTCQKSTLSSNMHILKLITNIEKTNPFKSMVQIETSKRAKKCWLSNPKGLGNSN
jgi:hypothetical protein